MIKREIIDKISKYFKLTEYEAEQVYDDIFSIIMNGVKEDNIVDVTNFGEFIIKYNNGKSNGPGNGNGSGSEYRKTVEFLSSSGMEEELNQSIIGEEPVTYKSGETTQTPPAVEEQTSERSSVEEELRRKREEILSKITGPILTVPPILSLDQKEEKPIETPEPEKIEEQTPAGNITEAPVTPVIEEHEEIKEAEEQVDELSQKSFSDYFSEVSGETKPVTAPEPLKEPEKDVIPKSAVLLHNEIVGSSEPPKTPLKEEPVKTSIPPVTETQVQPERRAEDNSYYIWYKDSESNPTDTQTLSYEYELLYQATKEAEYKSKLRIYVTTFITFFSIVLLLLIFSPLIYKFFFTPEEYKQNIEKTQEPPPDISEQKGTPNVIPENNIQSEQNQVAPPQDTSSGKQEVQNLQTEQQSTEQTPPVKKEEKQITRETSKQQKLEEKKQEQEKQKQLKLEEKKKEQEQREQKKQELKKQVQQKQEQKNQEQQKKQEQKKQEQLQKEQKKQEQKQQEQQKKEQQKPPVEKKNEGLVKNSMGWMDDKNKVIYIQLENGKYTIQESAWDLESKANKRLSTIESLGIIGLKGNIVKADLGAKGIWFRARFGEFSSLEEAQKKAEELRSKEKIKLHAMLAYLFLYT